MKAGQIVAVRFWDHVEDGGEPISFIVYGKVLKLTRHYVNIESWTFTNDEDRCGPESNVKSFCILRKAIERVDVLEPRS